VSLKVHSHDNFKTYIMLKNILKLEGTQELTKTAQKEIKGGINIIPVPVGCSFSSTPLPLCTHIGGIIIDGKCCILH
jgi:hypothetical protein